MGRTKHYVSSTVYSLAGDQKGRPDFVKVASIARVLSGSDMGFGEVLKNTMISGPGMNQRRFYKWAKDNYVYGVAKSKRTSIPEIPIAAIQAGMILGLALGSNVEVRALTSVIDRAEAGYWADAWVRANRPEDTYTEYLVYPAGVDQYRIVFSEVGPDEVTIPMPADYTWGAEDSARRLLYVLYQTVTTSVEGTTTVSDPLLYTYRIGSGNVVFDTLQPTEVEGDDYFPVIPLRWYNKSIRDASFSTEFPNIEKAYKKLTGQKIKGMLDNLEANESINDLDYAFIVQGVPLSTKNNAALGYLYEYFKAFAVSSGGSRVDLNNYIAQMNAIDVDAVADRRWLTATDPLNENREFHPMFGAPPPAAPQAVFTYKAYTERYFAPLLPIFDYYLTWNLIEETFHIGNAKNTITAPFDNTKLKKGDYWSSTGTAVSGTSLLTGNAFTSIVTNLNKIYLYKQVSKYTYSRLRIIGLNHRNNVYNGVSVNITGKSALEDGTENEPSGFIVPLHYPTLKALGLMEGTRLAVESNYLVINTHVAVKKKWYQTGIFKIILVIAVIVVSFIFAPAGAMAAKVGILGSNLAVGSAIGLTGTAAVVAGAVANAVAAMVVSSLIQKASVSLFGDKLGAIIGTIASFAAMQYGLQYQAHGNFDVDWGSLMKADNLIKLTNSVGSAYTQWLNADLQSIQAEMAEAKEKYGADLEKIEKAMDELTGDMAGLIDPMMLTDSTLIYPESSETYLTRTLLTGTDIAELSFSMIENFPEMSRELPKAFR